MLRNSEMDDAVRLFIFPIGIFYNGVMRVGELFSRSGNYPLSAPFLMLIAPFGNMAEPITSEQLGAAIRAARKAQGLRQDELAGAAGVGLRFVVELERGKPSVQLDKVLAVLAALGLTLRVEDRA